MKRFLILSIMLTIFFTGCKSDNTDIPVSDSISDSITTTTVQAETPATSVIKQIPKNQNTEGQKASSETTTTTVLDNADKPSETTSENEQETTAPVATIISSDDVIELPEFPVD